MTEFDPWNSNPGAFPPRKPPDPSSAPGTLDSVDTLFHPAKSTQPLTSLSAMPFLPPFPSMLANPSKSSCLSKMPPASHTPPSAAPPLPDVAVSVPSTSAALPNLLVPLSPNPPLTASQRNKLKIKAQRAQTREKLWQLSDNPLLKAVHCKCIDGAKASILNLDVDAGTLLHTKHAWMGPHPPAGKHVEDGGESTEDNEPQPLHHLDTGLGGISYMQAEVDTFSGTIGFMYIAWFGKLTIPILDSHCRVIALLGGTPRNEARWKVTNELLANLWFQCLVGFVTSHQYCNYIGLKPHLGWAAVMCL
ncbi:hypothetical protein B0H14DRAFT_3459724 [Mycena olivaceomarginata]|nr:hypothetical protein B0H14DRAFT_3459724 [Mycena olivaceomarginata]